MSAFDISSEVKHRGIEYVITNMPCKDNSKF